MSRRKDEEPDDPLMDELRALARKYGDPELLRACLQVVTSYAEVGARQTLTKRIGNPETKCPQCRERNAITRQMEATLKRVKTNRPIGGAAPAQVEDQ